MLKVRKSAHRNFMVFMSSFKCVCSLFVRVTIRSKLNIVNMKMCSILLNFAHQLMHFYIQ